MPHTEELLSKWMSKYSPNENFIKDGIVNISYWDRAPDKILFFLKELNMAPGSWSATRPPEIQRDFRKTVDEHPWKTVGQWAYGILNRRTMKAFYEANQEDNYSSACRSVAIVNLKKIAGDNSSRPREIIEYAIRNAEFLREQIELISPNIVVCCGRNLVFNIARKIFKDAREAELVYERKDFVQGRLYRGEKYYWIDFVHPRMRKGTQKEKYDSLMDIVGKIP